MDWDLKVPSWDFAELDRDVDPNIASVVVTAGGSGLGRQESDCSVDLKLGGLGDFGSSDKWKERQPSATPMVTAAATRMVSPSGSSKRARAPNNANQNVSCLVDGCKADLSNCREYHRRHKVCEAHSKTPMVLVGGKEQRFCQQCSRFHLLVEFDEVKRSCRKRLDGHNRRRRKPQPEPMGSGSLFPIHQGPRFSSYPHIFPAATPDPSWASVIKSEEDTMYRSCQPFHLIERQQHVPASTFRIYREGKQFPFLQDDDAAISSGTTLETSVCQPLLHTVSSSESNGRKMLPSGLNQVLDSDCALSLLSSPTQTPVINLGHMVPADQIPFGQPVSQQSIQPFGNLCRYSQPLQASSNVSPTGFSCSRVNDEQVSTVLISNASDASDLHCHSIFRIGGDGVANGHSEPLPFSWQ